MHKEIRCEKGRRERNGLVNGVYATFGEEVYNRIIIMRVYLNIIPWHLIYKFSRMIAICHSPFTKLICVTFELTLARKNGASASSKVTQ